MCSLAVSNFPGRSLEAEHAHTHTLVLALTLILSSFGACPWALSRSTGSISLRFAPPPWHRFLPGDGGKTAAPGATGAAGELHGLEPWFQGSGRSVGTDEIRCFSALRPPQNMQNIKQTAMARFQFSSIVRAPYPSGPRGRAEPGSAHQCCGEFQPRRRDAFVA